MSNPKKIGEGTYGCVHRPSLKCKDNKIISNYNDKISKIMEDEHAQTEMQEYVGINRIDPDNMYHIKPQECKPDNNAEMKKSILECNLGKEIVKKMDKYKLIVMKYGGPDLYVFFKNPMVDTHMNRERVDKFWIEAVNLFKAVQLFLKNGMIHHDLKPENIVYDENNHSLKVIDFGLLQKRDNIIKESNEGDYWLSMIHFNFPPELYFYAKKKWFENKSRPKPIKKANRFNGLGLSIKFETDYRKNLDTLINSYLKSETLNPQIKSDSMNGFLNFTEDYLSHNDTITYNKFLNDSIDTIDSYGLGMSLIYVLKQIHKLMNPTIVKRLHKLLINMINHDLRKRIRIDEALIQYKSIFKIHTTPIPNVPDHVSPSILPNGLIHKIGKRCPNGSKTYKYKGEDVCKKNNVSIKIRNVPVHISVHQLDSPLPDNMIIKTGKRCPNGSKTHKYRDKIVCLKNV